MQNKFTMRDGSVVKVPARNGETAENVLQNARRNGEKTIVLGSTTFLVADIVEAVDEQSRSRQTLEGI